MIPLRFLSYSAAQSAEESGHFPSVGNSMWSHVLKGMDLNERRHRYNASRQERHQANLTQEERARLHAGRFEQLIKGPRMIPEV